MKICGFFCGGGGGGSLRNRTIFSFFGEVRRGSFLHILGLFKVKIQNGNIFGPQISIFLGMPNIQIFFFFFFFLGGGG